MIHRCFNPIRTLRDLCFVEIETGLHCKVLQGSASFVCIRSNLVKSFLPFNLWTSAVRSCSTDIAKPLITFGNPHVPTCTCLHFALLCSRCFLLLCSPYIPQWFCSACPAERGFFVLLSGRPLMFCTATPFERLNLTRSHSCSTMDSLCGVAPRCVAAECLGNPLWGRCRHTVQRKRTARGWPCLGCVCGVCGVVVAPRDFGHGAVRLAGLRSRRRALYCWVCVCTGCCAVLCCVYAYFCCVCFVETAVCVTVRHVNLDMFH